MDIGQKLAEAAKLIGGTPLAKIAVRYGGETRAVYAKLENFNFTGSIKDRMALYMLRAAHAAGQINAETEICEATSGNTGISFAALGAFIGSKVTIFMPDWMSAERISLIKSFGATVNLMTREQGGFMGTVKAAADYAAHGNVYRPCQFENDANRMAHFTTTAPEIWEQMRALGVTPDAFVAGVGSGGTVMGVGDYLKNKNPDCKIHPMEPSNSPTMATDGKESGDHRIQGISDEFIPPIVDLTRLDEIVSVDDGDAIIAAQMLAKALGFGVGISSGANFLAALKVQTLYGHKAVATVFADDNKKYLSTDYTQTHPKKDGYISTQIEIIDCIITK